MSLRSATNTTQSDQSSQSIIGGARGAAQPALGRASVNTHNDSGETMLILTGEQVLALQTKVVNVRVKYIRPSFENAKQWEKDPKNEYVGRQGVVFVAKEDGSGRERWPKQASIWANPYKVGKRYTLEESLQQYRKYIQDKIKKEPTKYDLTSLVGKRLGCWCHPQPCHGDILRELVLAQYGLGVMT